jgi:hypothetical protein
MINSTIRFAAVSLLLAAPLAAQAHPSFVGTWEMDAAKSSGEATTPMPTAATYVITQRGDTIVVNETMTSASEGTITQKMTFGTDGKAWRNQMSYMGGAIDLSTTMSWDKGALLGQTATEVQGADVQKTDRWTLSADGKVLTIATQIAVMGSPYGGITLVFNKKN